MIQLIVKMGYEVCIDVRSAVNDMKFTLKQCLMYFRIKVLSIAKVKYDSAMKHSVLKVDYELYIVN